jgi:hypothetical protein
VYLVHSSGDTSEKATEITGAEALTVESDVLIAGFTAAALRVGKVVHELKLVYALDRN